MKILSAFFLLLINVSFNGFAQDKVTCTEYSNYILTHTLVPAGPIPTAFDPNGVYPYISYSETSNRPVARLRSPQPYNGVRRVAGLGM